MAQTWFVQINDYIDGPLSTKEVESRLQGGQLNPQCLVWGVGMDQWCSLGHWSQESQQQTSTMFEDTVTEIIREVWHYAVNGESFGPFQREGLIAKLKTQGSLGDVLLWTKGMKEWAPLFEFHDILTAVGVNKRQFPRADINGQITIKTNTGQILTAPLLTISEGGVGVQLESTSLNAGMVVTLEISSPAFRSTLNARAEVRYMAGGILGLKFISVNTEAKSAIISLVRQSQTRFVLRAS